MQQLEFFEIKSPCIGVCESGPKGYCLGCYRSREERLYWQQIEPDVKFKIIKACALRKKRAEAARRKKNSSLSEGEGQQDLFASDK